MRRPTSPELLKSFNHPARLVPLGFLATIAIGTLLLDEIGRASHALQTLFRPHKLNVAALGNVVAQLHVHVIARQLDDPAWPAPVWGRVEARAYEPEDLVERVRQLRRAFGA